jgi:hypothetical protein
MNRGGYNKEMLRLQSKAALLFLVMAAVVNGSVRAEQVTDLYVATVPAAGLSGSGLEEAFALALDAVLVKVTGRRDASAQRSAVGPAAALVRQYQPVPGGDLRVSFDAAALGERLDAAGLPVWAANRPRTLVILPSPGDGRTLEMVSPVLLMTAAARGLPVVLGAESPSAGPARQDPLLDPAATARAAGADLLLVGRPVPSGGAAVYRWTLARGNDRAEWQGDVAEGVHGLADRLAARYATAAGSGQVVKMRILGVDSFDAYGRLQGYLRTVGPIQRAELRRVTGDVLDLELDVRGSVSQLSDAIALQNILVPVSTPGTVELVYRLVGAP